MIPVGNPPKARNKETENDDARTLRATKAIESRFCWVRWNPAICDNVWADDTLTTTTLTPCFNTCSVYYYPNCLYHYGLSARCSQKGHGSSHNLQDPNEEDGIKNGCAAADDGIKNGCAAADY